MILFTHKKVGGIHFIRVGSFGFNFYRTRKPLRAVDRATEHFDAIDHASAPQLRSMLMSDGCYRFIRV